MSDPIQKALRNKEEEEDTYADSLINVDQESKSAKQSSFPHLFFLSFYSTSSSSRERASTCTRSYSHMYSYLPLALPIYIHMKKRIFARIHKEAYPCTEIPRTPQRLHVLMPNWIRYMRKLHACTYRHRRMHPPPRKSSCVRK